MHTIRIQRLVFPEADKNASLYFRSRPGTRYTTGVGIQSRRSATLGAACTFTTDTYFNSVFPAYWCSLGDIKDFQLKIRLFGCGVLRIVRSALGEPDLVLEEVPFSGQDLELVASAQVKDWKLDRPCVLFFEIGVGEADVFLGQADWFVTSALRNDVRLVGGYCTYQRENYLLQNIKRLSMDRDVFDEIHRFIIVDNGKSQKLRDHFADTPQKFTLYQQENVGGAGGFARVILEAIVDSATTHILLMDDDAVIEPESVCRMVAVFAIAREPIAVGGHMLDSLSPNVLFEAGAMYLPEKLKIVPLWHGLDLSNRGSLLLLSKPYKIDYNAWWFFGFPARAVASSGLPLPFFLRTDDIEFGHRLKNKGIATCSVPGVAVWHEPSYVKIGSWQSYFATRNLLVSATVHQDGWAKRAARSTLRRIITCLLSLDYYEAWLHICAAEDFLQGPQVLEQPPTAKLKELDDARKHLVAQEIDKTLWLRLLPLRTRFLYARRLRKLERRLQILRHWLVPAARMTNRDDLEGAIDSKDLAWWNVASRDFFAIYYPLAFTYKVRQRDRETFRRLYAEARRHTHRIIRDEAQLTAIWRGAFHRLTMEQWWKSYLRAGECETVSDGAAGTTDQ